MLPLERAARNAAVLASAAVAALGFVAGTVRLLPWLLDPAVPWRVAAPFARGLATVAVEAAIFVGWPVGWALACARFVERGEARVLQTLGESPAASVRRLARHGAVLAIALGGASMAYGSDASAPGRVATELVAQARASCVKATEPATYAIPFTELTWLCAPNEEPRLVGSAPGALGGAVFTASDARIAGDFRALQLDDARILLQTPASGGSGEGPRTTNVTVALHVGQLSMHGLAPWAHASTLPAPLRGLVLAASAFAAAWCSALLVLRRSSGSRVGALLISAAGPCAALALMRLLERADARVWLHALVPVAAVASSALLAAALSRLRRTIRAAST